MPRVGLVLPDELYDVELTETVRFARLAESVGVHSVWKGETSGSNSLATLGAIAGATEEIRLGTAIANVYSRSPTLLGMSAVTLDRLSDGRALLGLGVSSPPLVEKWHGMSYEKPLRRTRETIEIVRQVVNGGSLEYDGKIFEVGPYTIGLANERETVPIFNAAMGEANRRLTGEFADGWIPVLTPLSKVEEYVDHISAAADRAGRSPPTMAPWVPMAMADDRARAERQARLLLAQEMAMGYNRLVRRFGYGDEGDEAFEQWRAGDREAAAAAITDEMLRDFTVFGTPQECIDGLERFIDAGADLPIVWLPFAASPTELSEMIEFVGAEFC